MKAFGVVGIAACLLASGCGSTGSTPNPPSRSESSQTQPSNTSTTSAQQQLYSITEIDNLLLTPEQLGPDWSIKQGAANGVVSTVAWTCSKLFTDSRVPVPPGGDAWAQTMVGNDVPGLAKDPSTYLWVAQTADVYPTVAQASTAMDTLGASAASCGKNTGPLPAGQAAGTLSWNMAKDDESGGWSGWKNILQSSYDASPEKNNTVLLLLRKDNVVLALNITAATNGPYPGFAQEEQSILAKIITSLNEAAPGR